MRDLFHRLGTVELAVADAHKDVVEVVKDVADHESRLRKLEHLTAKVVGGAIVGSALGGWILSQLGGCVR